MKILGLSHLEPYGTYYHDTNVALVADGELRFSAPEERYQRIKHFAGFPAGALQAIGREHGTSLASADVVAVVAPDRRDEDGEPLASVANAPVGSAPFAPFAEALKLPGEAFLCDHQLAHASASFRLSPFTEAVVLSLDGMGHDRGRRCFGGVFSGRGNELTCLDLCFSEGNSTGLFYGVVTEALGWRISDGEGKTMALATSGDPSLLYDELLRLAPRPAGLALAGGRNFRLRSFLVNGRHRAFSEDVGRLRELARRAGRENLAAAAQGVLEDTVVGWVGNALAHTGAENVCLGGGVFLNVSLNSRLRSEFPEHRFFVPPAPADSGIAAGAALEAAARAGYGRPSSPTTAYLGPAWPRPALEAAVSAAGGAVVTEALPDPPSAAADLLTRGVVLGVFQGRSEWGPRALGNRSVLAHPEERRMRDRINLLLKQREPFMPFAPAVLEERMADWFDYDGPSPYMKFLYRALPDRRERMGAVLHDDGTARAQTVRREDNPRFHDLLKAFEARTGIPMVLNTSFNLHGLPIVESPADALDHLLWGCVDALLLDDLLVRRA